MLLRLGIGTDEMGAHQWGAGGRTSLASPTVGVDVKGRAPLVGVIARNMARRNIIHRSPQLQTLLDEWEERLQRAERRVA